MSSVLPQNQLDELSVFVKMLQSNPSLLHLPELTFFKDYLESLGAKLPEIKQESQEKKPEPKREPEPQQQPEAAMEVESEESEVELDNTGVIDADEDVSYEMGEEEKEVSEEDMDAARERLSDAQVALIDNDFDKAIQLYTEAIKLNPSSAMAFAKRAACFIKMQKPLAAIRDCDHGIKLNPDNATAYKFRGRAHRLLGHWEQAATDLRLSCKLDFSEQADEWLKEVTPNAQKLEEHRRKYERKSEEKKIKERQERLRKAKEERERAQKEASERAKSEPGFPRGGMEGMGMPDLTSVLSDPEIMEALQDPEVCAAFQDVSQNPANILKYQNNPKVQKLVEKMAGKMGSRGGGGGGGFPGGFPGAGGFPGGPGGFPGGFPGGPGGFPGGFPGAASAGASSTPPTSTSEEKKEPKPSESDSLGLD